MGSIEKGAPGLVKSSKKTPYGAPVNSLWMFSSKCKSQCLTTLKHAYWIGMKLKLVMNLSFKGETPQCLWGWHQEDFKTSSPFQITTGIWALLINSGDRGQYIWEGVLVHVCLLDPTTLRGRQSPESQDQTRQRTDGLTHKHTHWDCEIWTHTACKNKHTDDTLRQERYIYNTDKGEHTCTRDK